MMRKAGTITVKKAGEAIAESSKAANVQKQVVKNAAKPAPFVGVQKALKEPRAVSVEEAPSIQPAKASTTTTMMPWHGWFERWVANTFGQHRVEQFRRTVNFMPDDIYDLQQAPKPAQKIPISKTDPTITRMWRYPSPGSQEAPRLPRFEEGEDPFDSAYFKRDTKRRYMNEEIGNPELEAAKLELMDPNDPDVQEEKEKLAEGRQSSPGNKGRFATGPTKFDPTGLRASMSVTWSALEESLDKHMPDHLPTPTWAGKEAQVIAWYEERGLPVPIGAYYAPLKVPRSRRLARW